MSFAGPALAANWSEWELKNAVSRQKDWLVIRDPDDNYCYLKQSHHDEPWKMEFIVGPIGKPSILSPYSDLSGQIVFLVDKNPPVIIEAWSLAMESLIDLPTDILPQLKAGLALEVSVEPKEQGPKTQSFSLVGFSAALRWLNRPECQ
jgi:hypothetical protein